MTAGGHPEWAGFAPSSAGLGPLVCVQDAAWSCGTDLPGCMPGEAEQLRRLAVYVLEYLPTRDARVGRAGPVCPFTPGALRRRAMLLCAWRGKAFDVVSLGRSMSALMEAFSSVWGPDEGHDAFRSVSVVLPGLPEADASRLVQRVHDDLKPAFAAHGLMFGEFYPGCEAPGLHNPDFRPLRTPVPSLTVRPMTCSDEPFLMDAAANLAAYRTRFPEGPRSGARVRS